MLPGSKRKHTYMAKKNKAADAAQAGSKEYQLNQAPGTAPAPETAPAGMVNSLLLASAPGKPAIDLGKFERKNNPPMVLPNDVPVGSEILARFIKAIPSPVTTVKGNLLWLQHESGTEFTFPCTGVIRAALLPGSDDEKENREKNLATLNKEYVGKLIYLKRLENRASKKGSKQMFVFDVRVAKA